MTTSRGGAESRNLGGAAWRPGRWAGGRLKSIGGAVGGPAQGARRPEFIEDGGLGRDRTRRPTGQALSATRRPTGPRMSATAPPDKR